MPTAHSPSGKLSLVLTLLGLTCFTPLDVHAFTKTSIVSNIAHEKVKGSCHSNSRALCAELKCDSTQHDGNNMFSKHEDGHVVGRRAALVQSASAAALLLGSTLPEKAMAAEEDDEGYKVFTTRSGLKYIELREGTGPRPKFGQLVSVGYKGYLKVAGSKKGKPPMFDEDSAYLIKHGNGKIIPGLDEGIHTMKVGGLRRVIIPPKLGYVEGGLGPLPEGFIGRFKLNRLLDEMVEASGGQIIFDIELLSAFDDEADQGYYQDSTISPEDFDTLKTNLQKSASEARGAANGQANGLPGVGGEGMEI